MSATSFHDEMIDSYDRLFRSDTYYLEARLGTGFANLGYFQSVTTDHASACVQLMERLLARQRRRRGLILDVGCGLGGTTQRLTQHYPPERIHGVNISEYQLDECRRRLPGAHFHRMNAERLEFPDAMFDTVISIEAALHFKGRQDFLREAWRVLKPGGELLIADMLFHTQPQSFRKILAGQELYPNIGAYQSLLEASGFQDVSCEDVTDACWKGYTHYLKGRIVRDVLARTIDAENFQRLRQFAENMEGLPVSAYVFAHGNKPE